MKGQRVKLERMPLQVLWTLVRNPGVRFTSERLVDLLDRPSGSENFGKKHVGQIRKVLGDDGQIFPNEPNIGYWFEGEKEGPFESLQEPPPDESRISTSSAPEADRIQINGPALTAPDQKRYGRYGVAAALVAVFAVVLVVRFLQNSRELPVVPGYRQKDGLYYIPIPAGEVEKFRVTKFWMGQIEVPAGNYAGSRHEATPAHPDKPAVEMSLQDASKYCEFIGGRLPTDTEWLYAAAKAAAAFSAGPNTGQQAGGNQGFERNGLGFYNLGGSVWEWVSEGFVRGGASDLRLRQPADQSKGGADVGFRCVLDE